MFRNYLKVAYRNLMKFKFISFINLFGLTVGLTCCLLITAYILNELSYDKYNKNANNIYRVERTFLNPNTKTLSLQLGTVAPPFGPLLQNDFKEIKKVTRTLNSGTTAFKYQDNVFNQPNVYFADENLFDVFDFTVVQGDAKNALSDPYTLMLNEETAKKYFGNANPLDKVVKLNNQFTFKVSGVYKALPQNAHWHPDVLLSFNTLRDSAVYGEENLRTNYGNNSFFTYLLLPDHYDPKKLEAQFPAFQNRHIPTDGGGKIKPSDYSVLNLRKLTDIHLYGHTDLEAEVNGDIKRVYIFSAIALFILLIACINYMNLSSARSVLRAKEIGIRKVAGARRGELVAQFLIESVFISFLATILAFVLTAIALPWLNQLSGQHLVIQSLLTWQLVTVMLIVPFIVGILSGIYPALFLSSFQPVKVLKGILKIGGANVSFRKALVVLQFSISIILIISTAVVFQQLNYMQHASLGFDKEHVVTIAYNNSLNDNYPSFKTELLSNSNIKEVGLSSRIPTGRLLDANGSQINLGDSLAPTKADIKYVTADAGFIPAYNIKILAGRNFYQGDILDTTSFLINEAAVKVLGLKSNEQVIGKQFTYGGTRGTVAGVFNDFHFESLHQRIIPLVLFQNPGGYNNISIKITGNVTAALNHIESTWKKYSPEIPYQYNFLNDTYAQLYDSEQKQGSIFTAFSCIAIFIACLGLFGLSAFTITQRVKEIGIRKVLGASTASIVQLISKDFLLLVVIASVIAFPVAWFAMHSWLQDFAYRINIAWWIFIVAAIIAIIIAFVTISIQAIKAALSNPVNNLRTE